jgi:hypothetical protein
MRNTTVSLGETNYAVPHLNLGEIEEIGEVFENQTAGLKRAYALLEIILRRASPAVENVRMIEASPEELGVAINKALQFSGLQIETKGEPVPNASAPGEPAPGETSGSHSTDGSKPTAATHRHKSEH